MSSHERRESEKYEKVFGNSIYRSTNKTIAFIKNIYHSSDVGGVWKIAWQKSLFAII